MTINCIFNCLDMQMINDPPPKEGQEGSSFGKKWLYHNWRTTQVLQKVNL